VTHYKREVEIHKQVENNLVKRSSLSQTLVKQLNKKLKDLEAENKSLREQLEIDRTTLAEHSQQRSEKSREASDLPDPNEHKNQTRRLNN